MKHLSKLAYSLDLTELKGKGDFTCPRCGNIISPDDTSEENYSILEPKVNECGLHEIEIRCNKCSSIICLSGFSKLLNLIEPEKNVSDGAERQFYVAHI